MELTDAQVLAQLKMRRVQLKIQLERVEIAIKAFEKVGEIEYLDALPYLIDGEIEIDEELSKAMLMYNPKASVNKKIVYILSKIGEGDANDIAEYLLRIDGHIKNIDRVYNRITYVASRMYRTGVIDAVKRGKKNVYKLK